MRTPSPPGGSGVQSPMQNKPLGVSSTPGSFQVKNNSTYLLIPLLNYISDYVLVTSSSLFLGLWDI